MTQVVAVFQMLRLRAESEQAQSNIKDYYPKGTSCKKCQMKQTVSISFSKDQLTLIKLTEA